MRGCEVQKCTLLNMQLYMYMYASGSLGCGLPWLHVSVHVLVYVRCFILDSIRMGHGIVTCMYVHVCVCPHTVYSMYVGVYCI